VRQGSGGSEGRFALGLCAGGYDAEEGHRLYRSFKIDNFRCFERLTIEPLGRVNLIAGANNVGKTTLIEALFIHLGAFNPVLTFTVSSLRGISSWRYELGSPESPWDYLFPELDNSKAIKLVGDGRSLRLRLVREPADLAGLAESVDLKRYEPRGLLSSLSTAKVLELEYGKGEHTGRHFLIIDKGGPRVEPAPPPPPFPGYFLAARVRPSPAEQAERYSNLERKGDDAVVLQALQVMEPRLRRLGWYLPADQPPLLCGDVGFGLLPLQLMGGGMVCLAEIAIHVATARGGVLLIDELENGLHHSVMPKVWSLIADLARRFKVQIFATTHSMDCIIAAQRAFAGAEPDDFRLHRLERQDGKIRVVTYDAATLAAAEDLGLEVR